MIFIAKKRIRLLISGW